VLMGNMLIGLTRNRGLAYGDKGLLAEGTF